MSNDPDRGDGLKSLIIEADRLSKTISEYEEKLSDVKGKIKAQMKEMTLTNVRLEDERVIAFIGYRATYHYDMTSLKSFLKRRFFEIVKVDGRAFDAMSAEKPKILSFRKETKTSEYLTIRPITERGKNAEGATASEATGTAG